MTFQSKKPTRLLSLVILGLACIWPFQGAHANHEVRGIEGQTFWLYAYPFQIGLPEGSSMYMWGFGDLMRGSQANRAAGAGYSMPQYPGPTLIVTEGQPVTINLINYGVPDSVNVMIPGQAITANGGTEGLFTRGARRGQMVSYSFTPTEPGTYLYHSIGDKNPGLHQEMGLVGALIVRPSDYDPTADATRTAYGNGTETDFDQEYLYLLTEMDPGVHKQMERGHYQHFTNSDRFAKIWFVNGRVFPDLFQGDFNRLFPHQPYESLARSRPGDRVLVRLVNTGLDSHPFHFHGENLRFIARDGQMLSSDGVTANLGRSDNTVNSAPKQIVDAIWTWTGKDLNWDIFGPVNTGCTDANNNMADDGSEAGPNDEWVMCHDDTCVDDDNDGFDDTNHEYCADHGKALPVTIPGSGELAFGGWWSGSPYLGDTGGLPPGEGGLNPYGGYFFVWHSHAEKELTTFDIFPGGTLSAVVVLPPYVEID
jgi:hypothetical protein